MGTPSTSMTRPVGVIWNVTSRGFFDPFSSSDAAGLAPSSDFAAAAFSALSSGLLAAPAGFGESAPAEASVCGAGAAEFGGAGCCFSSAGVPALACALPQPSASENEARATLGIIELMTPKVECRLAAVYLG